MSICNPELIQFSIIFTKLDFEGETVRPVTYCHSPHFYINSMKFAIISGDQRISSSVESYLHKVLDGRLSFSVEHVSIHDELHPSLSSTKQWVVDQIFKSEVNGADYYVCATNGIDREFDSLYGFTFASVADQTRNRFGFGTSVKFPLPDDISGAVEKGTPLVSIGNHENGLVALSTGGNLTLSECVSSSLGAALIPFNFYNIDLPKDAAPELTRFADKINPVQRSCLASQLRLLDFNEVKTVDTTKTLAALEAVPPPRNFQAEREKVYARGVEHISRGECAVCIMAGGQGSRLRAPVPKAMMEVDLISKQTLLELQLRRIKRLVTLYGGSKNAPGIPVYILTSDTTHSPIAAYLLQNNNFGVPHVFLVKQRQLPARTYDGKFVLSEQWKVLAAPNGNGAIFQAFKESGAIEDMKRLGVKYVEIHPIDNALAKPADPFFVGALSLEDGDIGIKVIRKRPKEKIGTLCKRGGKTIVIEYSEIPAGEEEAYVWGNTGLQIYRTDLIEKAAEAELPYHIALKKENVINENGEKVMGDVKKFERFIFDAMEYAVKPVLVECIREEEFAPIKNPVGAEFDSPETARDLVVNLHKKWAVEAGVKFEGEGAFEFLPETTYDGEGLKERGLAGKVIKLPAQL